MKNYSEILDFIDNIFMKIKLASVDALNVTHWLCNNNLWHLINLFRNFSLVSPIRESNKKAFCSLDCRPLYLSVVSL